MASVSSIHTLGSLLELVELHAGTRERFGAIAKKPYGGEVTSKAVTSRHPNGHSHTSTQNLASAKLQPASVGPPVCGVHTRKRASY